ncbi:NADH:ubiquinone oxidoreductase [candidate division WOR-3 bacterium JGI_Cruoil_03_51_56]|uniref:NADH:ubiquinone oxidoreductase n=1 Tax=candidate division WOR-3 bacterium JGI_Cruoil_03_51_56 TaxID=1973747 RepID=A0A235BY80_UNCW3|nr:MAG: NADH:ubiquinone oxidoreductase [candidate division WOR-3 bacterium JGI_Cruoil_03_51_56]
MNKLGRWGLKRSPWVYHIAAASCNNCDIEILELFTPRYDVERFGIVLVGSPRHADVLLVTGVLNRKNLPRVLEVYEQTPKPCAVVGIGTCVCNNHIFRNSYNVVGPYDKYLPMHAYVPGCPPKPEAMIAGILKALGKL